MTASKVGENKKNEYVFSGRRPRRARTPRTPLLHLLAGWSGPGDFTGYLLSLKFFYSLDTFFLYEPFAYNLGNTFGQPVACPHPTYSSLASMLLLGLCLPAFHFPGAPFHYFTFLCSECSLISRLIEHDITLMTSGPPAGHIAAATPMIVPCERCSESTSSMSLKPQVKGGRIFSSLAFLNEVVPGHLVALVKLEPMAGRKKILIGGNVL